MRGTGIPHEAPVAQPAREVPGRAAPARRRRPGRRGLVAALSANRGGVARTRRVTERSITTIARSPATAAAALMLFFVMFSLDFVIILHPTDAVRSLVFEESGAGYTDARDDAAGAVKRSAGLLVYALALLMLIAHRHAVAGFLRRFPHWGLILGLTLAGMLWSTNPPEVLTNTVQLVAGLVLAIAFAATRAPGRRAVRSFTGHLTLALAAMHFVGLVLFVTQVGDQGSFFVGERRYGGAFGNPNGSAGNAVLGIWAALALLGTGGLSRKARWGAYLALALFAFSISVSGSATSTVAAGGVIAAVAWLALMRRLGPDQRVIGNLIGVLGAVLLGGALLLNSSGSNVTADVAGSLGKDATFTGRTELWALAREAISLKPILGWSQDSHESVISRYEFEIPYNHYHNGYLDLLLAGGAVLGALVAWNLVRFGLLWRRAGANDPSAILLGVPLFILLALNLTEYSLVRPLNVIWQLYTCAFCLLALCFTRAAPDARRARPRGAGARTVRRSGREFTF